MKVIVAKMPGGKAVSVELGNGATILDAISAAGYSDNLEGGFELRKNDTPATASDTVAQGDIIALAGKVSGNAAKKPNIGVLNVVVVAKDATTTETPGAFVRNFPIKVSEFFNPIDDDNKLAIQGYILAHTENEAFDANNYRVAVLKKDQTKPVRFKSLNGGNLFLSPDSLLVICEKGKEVEIEDGAKYYKEHMERNDDEMKVNEKTETPKKRGRKPKAEKAAAAEVEKTPKKRGRKSKAEKVCSCHTAECDVTECSDVNVSAAECNPAKELFDFNHGGLNFYDENISIDCAVKKLLAFKELLGDVKVGISINFYSVDKEK